MERHSIWFLSFLYHFAVSQLFLKFCVSGSTRRACEILQKFCQILAILTKVKHNYRPIDETTQFLVIYIEEKYEILNYLIPLEVNALIDFNLNWQIKAQCW